MANLEIWDAISLIVTILLCLFIIVVVTWFNFNKKLFPTTFLTLMVGLIALSTWSLLNPIIPIHALLVYSLLILIYIVFQYAKLKYQNPTQVKMDYTDNAKLISYTQEQERSRIYANLHDDVGANLLELIYTAKDEETKIAAKSILKNIRQAVALTENIQCNMIQLAESIISEIQMRLQPTSITLVQKINLLDEQQKMSSVIPNVLLRISREVVSNIIKHAKSTEIKVEISSDSSILSILITDNGRGFIDGNSEGKGLKTIKKRAQSINADAQWDSDINQGTTFKLNYKYDH